MEVLMAQIKFYHLWHAIVLGYTCRSELRLAQHT